MAYVFGIIVIVVWMYLMYEMNVGFEIRRFSDLLKYGFKEVSGPGNEDYDDLHALFFEHLYAPYQLDKDLLPTIVRALELEVENGYCGVFLIRGQKNAHSILIGFLPNKRLPIFYAIKGWQRAHNISGLNIESRFSNGKSRVQITSSVPTATYDFLKNIASFLSEKGLKNPHILCYGELVTIDSSVINIRRKHIFLFKFLEAMNQAVSEAPGNL